MPGARFIAVHGHFYQPPRENPWLEAVETQDSAHPYHDWNERITAECYAPNASARILDDLDRILRIVNNYATISFNFGPTLLSWLEPHAPETYAAIIDADRASRARFSGHGSAIAQGYNHMIMPLANARDRRTQVRWGVRDFEHRFGRKPEGMWLPETAVDTDSLEAMAAEGIRFTILEPGQARRWRSSDDSDWSESGVDPTMPYRCNLPSGKTIAIFFYDGPISRAVAFESLLARGEFLAERLGGAFDPQRTHDQLVNIATDGETYGHHHRYGDMALAYALHYIEDHGLAKLTNYGEFLEKHPPTREVEIRENTAWSCVHGVERWRSDCSCSTGGQAGWNQRWRTPLRETLDWLRDETVEIFERHASDLIEHPWRARDDYIDVVLDRSDDSLQRFLGNHAHPDARANDVLNLLEMQRNAMLMYTSCGWFFNEISGIETVQVLHYAARVIQLAETISGRPLESDFVDRLAPAQSNLPDKGSARDIYERDVKPTVLDLTRVASHYAVASLFDNFDDDAEVYCYRVQRHDFDVYRAGRARMAVASITVTSQITRESQSFSFAVLHLGETELTGGVAPAISPARSAADTGENGATGEIAGISYEQVKQQLAEAFEPGGIPATIRLLDQHFSGMSLSVRSLFRDEQRRILHLICNATLEEAESAFRQLHERYDPLMRFHTRLGIPLPKVLQIAAEFDLNMQLRRLLETDDIAIAEVEGRLREARDERAVLDDMTLMALKDAIERASARFAEDPADVDRLEAYEAIIALVRTMDLRVSMRKPQTQYFRMASTVRPAIAASSSNGQSQRWLALFDALGEQLSFAPEVRG
jgi:alpha-amylase/alpha-mannosidase (GH57 family)